MKPIAAVLARLGLNRMASHSRSPWDQVVVVFTRTEKEVARLNVATGPCVPRPGTKRPLVGVTNQQPGDPSRYEALFRVLISDPSSEPWDEMTSTPPGRMSVFSSAFVNALAELNREGLRRQVERPADYEYMLEPERLVLRAWMPLVDVPLGVHQAPNEVELIGASAWARSALDTGRKLYCWSGAGFNPWTVSPGRGERLWKRAKTRAVQEPRR